MSLNTSADQLVLTSRELLPRVLHELAQPLSALECSLELNLQHAPDLDRYRHSLESSLQIAQNLSERLIYFRELSEAIRPCDCLRPVDAGQAVRSATREINELAESLDFAIAAKVDALPLYGNTEKLQYAFVRLFDWLLQGGCASRIHLVCDGKRLGEILVTNSGTRQEQALSRSLEIVYAALTTIGATLEINMDAPEVQATVSFSPYRQPAATTSVLVGDF